MIKKHRKVWFYFIIWDQAISFCYSYTLPLTELSKSLCAGVSNCDDFYVTAYSQSWETCVYVLSSLAFAPGGLLLRPTVYVHSGGQPPSTDINSGKRDRTTMCECSFTVNISLAVSCPLCQHSHSRKVWPQCGFNLSKSKCYLSKNIPNMKS